MNKIISSFYIHFPFCFHLCNYCDFYKMKKDNTPKQLSDFHGVLRQQWATHQELLQQRNFQIAPLQTLYLGGGTPSLWGSQGIELFSQEVLGQWLSLAPQREFTMEVDPNTFEAADLPRWKELGVNRVSIGAQAFDDQSLKILDRKHTKRDVARTIEICRKHFDSISVDFLIGIPVVRDLKSELTELLQHAPDHMSVYMLSTRANYPHKEKLPDEEQVAWEYLTMVETLEKAGLMQYEVSNFARTGHKSQHNLSYWACQSVGAIGPSATGLLVEGDTAYRYKWKVMSGEYQPEELTQQQFLIEKVYMHLRSELGLDMQSLFGHKAQELQQLLSRWDKLEYLKKHTIPIKVQLTPKGYLMLDSIMGDLFAYGLL